MKTLVTIFALLALSAVGSAFAAENVPLPGPAAASAPVCSPAAASAVPNPQESELPSWLTAEKPLIWTGEVKGLTWLSQSCGEYCMNCGGCCAILGPNSCACC